MGCMVRLTRKYPSPIMMCSYAKRWFASYRCPMYDRPMEREGGSESTMGRVLFMTKFNGMRDGQPRLQQYVEESDSKAPCTDETAPGQPHPVLHRCIYKVLFPEMNHMYACIVMLDGSILPLCVTSKTSHQGHLQVRSRFAFHRASWIEAQAMTLGWKRTGSIVRKLSLA